MSAARYLLVVAARGRDPLPPLAASLLVLLGIFAYRPNELAATMGLTALASVPLCGWLAAAVLRGEPRGQADAMTVALGGPAARARLQSGLIAAVAAAAGAIFISYPLLLGLYDRPAGAGDLLAGGLAHLTCGLLGGATGVLFSAPRIPRPGTQATASAAAFIALAALPGPLGPVASARALAEDGGAGALLLACAGTMTLAVALHVLTGRWTRRLG